MNYIPMLAYIVITVMLFACLFDNNDIRRKKIMWLSIILIGVYITLILLSSCTPTKGGTKPKTEYIL